jgi:hypothetical protein
VKIGPSVFWCLVSITQAKTGYMQRVQRRRLLVTCESSPMLLIPPSSDSCSCWFWQAKVHQASWRGWYWCCCYSEKGHVDSRPVSHQSCRLAHVPSTSTSLVLALSAATDSLDLYRGSYSASQYHLLQPVPSLAVTVLSAQIQGRQHCASHVYLLLTTHDDHFYRKCMDRTGFVLGPTASVGITWLW